MSVSSNHWDMNRRPTWVIHKTWAGGSAARVLFFTREQGLVWASCQGGWSPKKQALIQAYHPLWATFTQRHGWHYVQHMEHAGMAFDYTAANLLTALYVNELLYHGLRPQDPHPELYDAYITTLQNLSLAVTQPQLEQVLRRFEWALLSSIGYAISLTHDAQTYQPIVANHYYVFQAGLGLLLAQEGLLGADILAIANDDLTDLKVLKTAKHMMRTALHHALGGKRIKSRDFYRV